MIAYLEGKLLLWKEEYLIVNVNGVGYQVFVPSSTLNQLPLKGEKVSFYIHTVVREDAITLYGFISEGELDFFKQLITVSGIGPKVATGIISALPVSVLKKAIFHEDVNALKKIPGIGEKTAKRLILELKNKIDIHFAEEENKSDEKLAARTPMMEDAVDALITLGYSRLEAIEAVGQIEEKTNLELIIRQALKFLGKGKLDHER